MLLSFQHNCIQCTSLNLHQFVRRNWLCFYVSSLTTSSINRRLNIRENLHKSHSINMWYIYFQIYKYTVDILIQIRQQQIVCLAFIYCFVLTFHFLDKFQEIMPLRLWYFVDCGNGIYSRIVFA